MELALFVAEAKRGGISTGVNNKSQQIVSSGVKANPLTVWGEFICLLDNKSHLAGSVSNGFTYSQSSHTEGCL